MPPMGHDRRKYWHKLAQDGVFMGVRHVGHADKLETYAVFHLNGREYTHTDEHLREMRAWLDANMVPHDTIRHAHAQVKQHKGGEAHEVSAV